MSMWQETNNKLYQKFEFRDFNQAMDFIEEVRQTSNWLNHHPVIKNTFNIVELWLSTHDEGNKITNKDREFARQIDMISFPVKNSSSKVRKVLKLYADGGSRGNPGPSASGFVLMDEHDNVIKKSGVYLGITTNNQAEYHSLKFGLEEAYKLNASEVHAYMDSLLVVNQMKGIYKIKNRDLWPLHEAIQALVDRFKKVTFTHVPRELNKLADSEVNDTLDAELKK